MSAVRQIKPSAGLDLTVKKGDFLSELGLVRDAAEKKTTIPILGNVLLEASGGTLTLTATSLEIAIRSSCPAKVTREGSGTMPARKLFDYVKLLPDGDVGINFTDAHWAGMLGGRNRARIAGMSRESFPELPEMPEPVASLPIKALSQMIARVQFAISAEESRFTLNGALLILRDSSMTLVATDGHRLACTVSEQPLDGQSLQVLIPKKVLSEVVKLGADADDTATLEFAMDDGHLFFRIGPRLLIAQRVNGNFPDYTRVLPSGEAHVALVDRAALLGLLARVSEFSDERSQACRVQFSAGLLRVFASCVETGDSEETCECEYSGPEMEIGFNASYLMQFLSAAVGVRVEFRVTDAKEAGELRPELMSGGESYRYVVMPMRV